jgi:putative hemolysin
MASIAIEIALIFVLIIANGIFSGSEIAVVSARKVRLEQLADQGNRKARVALKLVNSPNDFLSTVQIGITLIGTLSGAVGGATLAQRLKPIVDEIPILQPYSEGISLAIVVTIITYLSLVIGELVPKRIALNEPEQIACSVAKPMQFLSRLTAPLVNLLSLSTEALLKILNIRASTEPEVTEEEIKVLIRQGAESGMFEEAEHEMVERVFRLGDRPIKALMTPRIDVVWLDVSASSDESIQKVIESTHSRFPVARDSLDNCIGVLRGTSLLTSRLLNHDINLEEMVQPPLYVAETTRVLNVFEQFKEAGSHMALVIDEYGGIEGVVTLNDLMEAIVGDLPSLEDKDEPLMIQREDGSWLLDGSLGVDVIKELFDKDLLPGEDTGNFHTLGGFVMHSLGHIPESGQYFKSDNLRFEVVDMDGTRVDKVLAMVQPVQVIVDNNSSEND